MYGGKHVPGCLHPTDASVVSHTGKQVFFSWLHSQIWRIIYEKVRLQKKMRGHFQPNPVANRNSEHADVARFAKSMYGFGQNRPIPPNFTAFWPKHVAKSNKLLEICSQL
jgi:hypothetical protein